MFCDSHTMKIQGENLGFVLHKPIFSKLVENQKSFEVQDFFVSQEQTSRERPKSAPYLRLKI